MKKCIQVKLMPEYGFTVVWIKKTEIFDVAPQNIFDFDPPLKQRIHKWAGEYDAILNQDNPRESGFASPEAEIAFDRVGRKIAMDMQVALGDLYHVTYYSVVECKVIEI